MYRLVRKYPDYGTYMNFVDFPGCGLSVLSSNQYSNIFKNFVIVAHLYSKSKFPLEGTWFRGIHDSIAMRRTEIVTCADMMYVLPDVAPKDYIDLVSMKEDLVIAQAGKETLDRMKMMPSLIYCLHDAGGTRSILDALGPEQFLGISTILNRMMGGNEAPTDFDDGCSLSDISEEALDDGLTLDDLNIQPGEYDYESDGGLTFEDLNIH